MAVAVRSSFSEGPSEDQSVSNHFLKPDMNLHLINIYSRFLTVNEKPALFILSLNHSQVLCYIKAKLTRE